LTVGFSLWVKIFASFIDDVEIAREHDVASKFASFLGYGNAGGLKILKN
jgi:hypothetical protein